MDQRGYATMAGLLRTAGMDSVVSGELPYTIFVPSEDAFKKLPPGTLERLRKPEYREELKQFLNHHLMRGRSPLKSLIDAKTVRLNDDRQVTVSGVSGFAQLGDVLISASDDEATNGFIHRIDAVLPLPQ
jgi:uncharacterized surface protein with fasciclin (FAS1) repeats